MMTGGREEQNAKDRERLLKKKKKHSNRRYSRSTSALTTQGEVAGEK